ncbi:ATP-binding cassette domain-containing protein [Methanosarcina sp. DH1]|uniref:ABC transporter ATP-binding protein n=1 Tax=Methanosarcina sp. DH1 TaxID=2605695 RepID=UPI001E46566D|nr:ATP-binding cassette domain-containing protein [Methanosarcina sp. DH1]MCC4768062.1 ATP-binding cassette domain-containing protein [Methanosarcina sp. DH1]
MFEVRNLSKVYNSGIIHKASLKAVDDVTFSVDRGETVGIIGESGCGKTSLAKMVLKLLKSSSGSMYLNGEDVSSIRGEKLKNYRRKVQIIFQNPESSINPHMKIYNCIAEVLRINKLASRKSEEEKALINQLISMVGLQQEHLNRYSWELSGGQIQRVALSRVLALKPELLVADEPTSMLDVSVQAQVLTLLRSMQREQGFAMLFISHDLDVVRIMCDRVIVMFMGKIVESGTVDQVFSDPCHTYTKSLIEEYECLR